MSLLRSELVQRFAFFSLVVLCVAVGAPLLTSEFTGPTSRLVVAAFAALILFLGFRVATFTRVSANRVRLSVMAIAAGLCFAVLQFQSKLGNFFLSLWNTAAGDFGPAYSIPTPNETQSTLIAGGTLLTIVVVGFLVLRSLRDSAPMGEPARAIADVLPAVTNLDRLETLVHSLRHHLDVLDHATQWSADSYVPLEAEVQIIEGRTTSRRIVDLLSALSLNARKRMLFLVLGDPGSGKSVAMRKLARDLLAQKGPRDRIPIYINLKEWRPDSRWTPDAPPKPEDFGHFVFHHILQNVDLNSQTFLKDNYQLLHEAGNLFFILDSFDEIPAVLDKGEDSWLIEALSNCIVTYVIGGKNARGVIASRLFRKPRIVHENRSVYEIRPFSDDRILQAIRAGANNPDRLTRIVLTERPDLGSIARNPFLLQLIINYFNLRSKAPEAQAMMFGTYFAENIRLARAAYHFNEIDDDRIGGICEGIALAMFEHANFGLEIEEGRLRSLIDDPALPEVIRFLGQARIARIVGPSGTFSFSHRRFHEYFLVRCLEKGRAPVAMEAIQTDSRWRDSLVLYAEIAPDEEALRLAQHAWSFISRLEELSLGEHRLQFIEARNALRFVVEGFRNRIARISEFHDDLARLVRTKLYADVDLIEKKTIVEAIGLLPVEKSAHLILDALLKYPGWISESAVTAARYLPKVDRPIAHALFLSIVKRPMIQGLKEAKRQEPVFALSSGLTTVSDWLKWFRYDSLLAIGALTVSLFSPLFPLEVLFSIPLESHAGLLFYFIFGFFLISYFLSYDRFFDRWSVRLLYLILSIMILFAVVQRYPFIFFILVPIPLISIQRRYWENLIHLLIKLLKSIHYIPKFIMEIIKNRPIFIMEIIKDDLVWIVPLITFIVVLQFGEGIFSDQILLFLGTGFAYIAGLLLAFAVLAPLYFALCFCWRWFNDRLLLNEFRRSVPVQRPEIARQFLEFKTPTWRLRYVDWLEEVTINQLEALCKTSNVWPEGRRPQIEGDPASTRLAQLDARWLGLD